MRLRCDRMLHGGLCFARTDDDTTVLVGHALPGELADVRLRYRKGRTWFGDVVQVLDASPHRVEPPCPYVPACGGCQLQHVAYDEQLQLKQQIVVDALQRQGVTAPAVRVRGAAEPFEYRWRGEFHVVPGGEGLADAALGFNRARSWKPIAVEDCLIHHGAIRRALPALCQLVQTGGTPELRVLHVTVGDSGHELVVRGKPRDALDAATVDRVSLTLDAARFSTQATTLTWRGHVVRATPDTFIQVNWAQMDVLYQCAIDALGEAASGRIVDAYAGIGVLPVHLASAGAKVCCIESNPAAARAGMHNARLNGVEQRIAYTVGSAERTLAALAAGADAVILDPPRAGCAGAVTGWLALSGPPTVVYISCDPATLARDLHVVVASGPYTLAGLDVVDMFPQTYHVECVARLIRSSI